MEPSEKSRRRSHGRITMQEVARAAGVTTMTVSRCLNSPHLVSESTLALVQTAIQNTGYAPNKQAGVLASGQSNLVAALVPNIANSIFAETIQGLTDALSTARLELMLLVTHYDAERELELLRAVMGWQPAALAVTGRKRSTAANTLLARAQSWGSPIVQMWESNTGGKPWLHAGFNHRQAGSLMADVLCNQGHTSLAFVLPFEPKDIRAKERAQGFVARCAQRRAQARVLTASASDNIAAGRAVLAQVLDQGEIQALAFANDNLAAGAMLLAMERKLSLPQDIALLGFGDFALAKHIGQGLSTLAVPRYAIGYVAGLKILHALNRKLPPDSDITMDSTLSPHYVQRATT